MFWKRWLAEKNIRVTIIKSWQQEKEYVRTPGVLVKVENGKGLLRQVYGESEAHSYVTLMMGDLPLIQFQDNEYYCPTCEKIVKSGYGMNQSFHLEMPEINWPKSRQPLEDAVKAIVPLLGLLKTGYYVILDTMLHPTDGNGEFFWDRPRAQVYKGSCLYYHGDGEWGTLRPHFMIATQPAKMCRMERVEHYRAVPDCRAVAYYLDGYLTAIVDGHHKACAAALDQRDVNALVIMPGERYCYQEAGRPDFQFCYRFGELRFSAADLGEPAAEAKKNNVNERISKDAVERLNETINKQLNNAGLPFDTGNLASCYPDADGQAAVDRAGEIDADVIADLVNGRCDLTPDEGRILMAALSVLRHPDGIKAGKTLMEQRRMGAVYPDILGSMMTYPRTEELEQYFIEQLAELEGEYPSVKQIILKYL